MTSLYAPGTAPVRWGSGITPEHLLTPQAQGVGDDSVALLPGWSPCAVCGQAAPKPTEPNGRVQVSLTRNASGAASELRAITLLLTRCDDCQETHHRAEAIVAAHPGLAAQLGPGLAVERVEAVLVALRLLGQPLPDSQISATHLG